jgi:hypothetical protein
MCGGAVTHDEKTMKPNHDKIDDAVLALLFLTSFTEGHGEFAVTRAWKGHDWDALDRLHQKGLVADPKNKAKSVVFTDAGQKQAEELFKRLFCE